MFDRAKLREVVRCNIELLCRTLFPSGKRVGNEWRIGNTAGDPGDSLGIQLTGDKAGLFHDRATGEGGDFVSLVEAKLGVGFREAVDWVEWTLGIGLQCKEIHSASFAGERKESTQTIRQPEPELPVDQLKICLESQIAVQRRTANSVQADLRAAAEHVEDLLTVLTADERPRPCAGFTI
jgi:hypothetical protein